MSSEHLKGPPVHLPILKGMCGICQLCAVGLAQQDGGQYFATLVRLATLARSEGHSRFHRRMNRRMEEKKMGINLELLNEITFIEKIEAGIEFSKIAPPVPDNENGEKVE
jgi:hypothetical protein